MVASWTRNPVHESWTYASVVNRRSRRNCITGRFFGSPVWECRDCSSIGSKRSGVRTSYLVKGAWMYARIGSRGCRSYRRTDSSKGRRPIRSARRHHFCVLHVFCFGVIIGCLMAPEVSATAKAYGIFTVSAAFASFLAGSVCVWAGLHFYSRSKRRGRFWSRRRSGRI